ncbi:alpha/beta hydrolase [Aspergillus candidus]|uniref:Alpha/beta-hydrolase n=1 Tax=Aspergillus candidus TaxID=41067 RepID=A0A2I2FE26_ASPCN|nr:alpha/beta-hydrolase [Aspergillus candidus]PLB38882.1 alpha/beta-hydrolase [Aspergillus candidus]
MADDRTPLLRDTAIQPQQQLARPKQRWSLLTRLSFIGRIWVIKVVVRIAVSLARRLRISQFRLQSTYRKHYPVGQQMWNDVWIPSSHEAGQTHPLYIDIHGGGFATGDPSHDGEFCRYLADEHGICVVSVNYPKAPRYQFPCQTDDLVQTVRCVLADDSLPVDRDRVAMGGFSAGGNLSLSVALRDEIQGSSIKGVLAWYPVTDFSGRYKGTYRPDQYGMRDVLEGMSDVFYYSYVPDGQNLRDPFLSPVYADRRKLPPKIFFIGAEHDILCREAECTARIYAEGKEIQQPIGEINDWAANGIRWKRVTGAQHGFNFVRRWVREREEFRHALTQRAYADAAKWLKTEIYDCKD